MKKLCKWMLVICCCVFALGALAASAADTVYVKDGGKGDGSSASSPLGDLADAIRAVSGGGKVVLTGDTSVAKSAGYDASISAFTAPAASGTVTITAQSGARLIFPDAGRFFCTGDTTFENITFYNANKKTLVVAGRFFALTFGDGVVMDNIEVHVVGGMEHTNATVSVPDDDYSRDAHVTLLSGRYAEVTGLGRNTGKASFNPSYTGAAYITIGGDAVIDKVFGAYRWGGKAQTTGKVFITLDGGAVTNFITACGSEKITYTVDATVTLTEHFDPAAYFKAVKTGWSTSGVWHGLTGGPAYGKTCTNYGKTVLDLSRADKTKVTDEWIAADVNTDAFDSIVGKGTETPAASDASVVFLSDLGDDAADGSSADKAVQTLGRAFKRLSEEGGTIVLCGKATVPAAMATFPERSGEITFTSSYGGKVYDGSLVLEADIFLGSPVRFEQLLISSKKSVDIFCRGNNFTVGEGVTCTYAGNPIAIWGGTDCAIAGTTAKTARFFGYKIEIHSGTWWYVRGGSIRTGEYQPVGTIGDVTIEIHGGTFTSTTTNPAMNGIIAVGGFDALDGDATIRITGGKINSSVCGIGRPGTNATTSGNAYVRGNVTIEISGGNFRTGTEIAAVHDRVAGYVDGDFTLRVTGGSFAGGFKGANGENVRGVSALDLADGISMTAVGFDPVLFVSGSGSDAADGKSAATAKKTLAAAVAAMPAGGTVVVAGNLTVGSETLAATDKALHIVGAAGGKDFGATLTVTGTLTLGGETYVENLRLGGNGKIDAAGHLLTVGEGVSGGSLTLDGGTGEGSHGIVIRSGSFAAASGGRTAAGGRTFVLLLGGHVGSIAGSSQGSAGSGFVSVRGGSADSGYTPVKADKTVLYVQDGGEGDGSLPTSPMGDLAAASAALPAGGTIVVCGNLTVSGAKTLAAASGKLTVTSLYGGVDYRLTDGAKLVLSGSVTLGTETTFTALDIETAVNDAYIAAAGKHLTIGEDVVCTLLPDARIETYPALVGGSVALAEVLRADVTLDIYSGTWGVVTPGQYSTAAGASARRAEGNLTLNLYGGSITGGIYVAGVNSLTGDATFSARGGIVACPVIGAAAETAVRGNVTVNAAGASFEGDIRAGEDNTASLDGAYRLVVTTSDIRRVGTVSGTAGMGGSHTSAITVPENMNLSADVRGDATYQNPIAGYADPSVVYADGWYYYTYAKDYAGKPAVYMAKAANLFDIGKVTPVLIWSQALSGQAKDMEALWAPQLYKLDGKWYIYAACQFPNDQDPSTNMVKRYPYVWVAETDDPIGSYQFFGCMENLDKEAFSYLSPRIIQHDGNTYMFFSGFWRAADGSNGTHIQRMRVVKLESPTRMADGQVVISSPMYSYEKGIMEGPFPFYAPDGTLYLLFAAGHTRTDEYCTGMLRFTGGKDDPLTDASLWKKYEKPLQFTDYASGVYSPGAMIVTTSPDGKDYYGVFHAKEYHYSAYTMRRMYMQKIDFAADGTPTMTAVPATSTVYTMTLNPLPLASRISGFDTTEAGEAVNPFRRLRTYTANFTDVPQSSWFSAYVASAYEYALANGTAANKFSPDGSFTVAQALTVAANIHTVYYGKAVDTAGAKTWYEPYVAYCIANGIIQDEQFDDYNRNITRGEMAVVFANILPEREYAGTRTGSPADVTDGMACAAAVKKLFAAGIVGGDAGTGKYRPDDSIRRSEACVIFTRIAAAEYRIK